MKSLKISRRNFLRQSARYSAGMFSATLLPAHLFGKTAVPPPSERITVGHIGVGGQGTGLLRNFLQVQRAQSIAVCDPFLSRQEERATLIDQFYAEKYGLPDYHTCAKYTDFRELLARDDLDAVVIATPDHWHVPIAIAAAKAGKDVYVEKPLGLSVAENQSLRKIIRQYDTIFQYGTQQRSGRNFRFACELVRNGKIGRLEEIHAWCPDILSQEASFHAPGGSTAPIPVPEGFDYDLWLGPAPWSPYTSDRCTSYGTYHHYDNSLGFIAGWGAHPIDIAQWGNHSDHTAAVEYEGTGTFSKDGLYESIRTWDVHCRYENGVRLHFLCDTLARPLVRQYHPQFRDHGTTFIGTDGWVSVDRAGIYAKPEAILQTRLRPDEIHLYNSANHYENFIDCVRRSKTPISPIDAAVQSDIMCHLSDICIRMNRKIRWDPFKEEIINDPEASRLLSRPLRSPWHL